MSEDIVARLRELHRHTAGDAADEIERLRMEVEAFRKAIRTGDGPSCEDVCLKECIGSCGVAAGQSDWSAA